MNKLGITKLLIIMGVVVTAATVYAMKTEHKENMNEQKLELVDNSRIEKFEQSLFDQAVQAGGMVVLDFYKEGCPVCAKQHPTLEKAANMYPDAKFFKVNFKTETDTVRDFKVGSQSTIIVYAGGQEVSRSVGQTKESKLLEQFNSAKGMK
jgi:thiol-disulfide isomerase/thioredoxin